VIYFVTGTLGSGKSLCAVGRIRDYLAAGRPVATNMDIYPWALMPPYHRGTVHRLPDWPTAPDIEALPNVCNPREEKKFGALVLDEAGMFLSSRAWNERGREQFVTWLRNARKKGWDVYLIVQDVDSLDKQVRDALEEHVVKCWRMDRWMMPFVGRAVKSLTGIELKMPRIHVAAVRYADMLVERWWYNGRDIQDGYDTGQVLQRQSTGAHSILSAWHVKGRYVDPIDWPLFFRVCWFRWLPALLGQCHYVPRVTTVVPRRSVPTRNIYFPHFAID